MKMRGVALALHGAAMAVLWWALSGHGAELGGSRAVSTLAVAANLGYVVAGALFAFGADRARRAARMYVAAVVAGGFVASWAGATGVVPAATIVCGASFLVLMWGEPGRVRAIVGWLAVAASTLLIGGGALMRLGRAPLRGPPVAFEMMRVDDDFDPLGASPAMSDGFSVEVETIGEREHRYLQLAAPPEMNATAARRFATEWVAKHFAIAPGIRVAWKDDSDGASIVLHSFWLREPPFITSADVASAVVYDHDGPTTLLVSFHGDGAERFRDATRDGLGKRLAVLFDGAVMIAPVVRAEILTGQVSITLGEHYDRTKAEGLAAGLRGDLLHAP
ncbi:MAG TPA: hypothetical protein VGH28_00135 [Polyangiaceae bacterium]|jgi:hypothetical protein